MPKINKALSLEVTPEQFVNACDPVELLELQIELERRIEGESKSTRRKITVKDLIDVDKN